MGAGHRLFRAALAARQFRLRREQPVEDRARRLPGQLAPRRVLLGRGGAEDHLEDSALGETMDALIRDQFTRDCEQARNIIDAISEGDLRGPPCAVLKPAA